MVTNPVLMNVVEHWGTAFACLVLALVSTSWAAWAQYRKTAWALAGVSLGLGLAQHIVEVAGALYLMLFLAVHAVYKRRTNLSPLMQQCIAVSHLGFALLFYLHFVPGFSATMWLPPSRFYADGSLFVSYLNVDKIIVGSVFKLNVAAPQFNGFKDAVICVEVET